MIQRVKDAAGYGPDRAVAEAAFADGERLFLDATKQKGSGRTETFMKAAELYETAAKRWPDSTLEEDALFMWSEAEFFADRYPEAARVYETLVKKYPNTRHIDIVDKRRFSIARYWVEHHQRDPDLPITPNLADDDRPLFDKFGNAIRTFNKIRLDDPTGLLADDATMAAGQAHFNEGNWTLADEMFEDLRRSFPDSDHQFQAHLLGLQCKLKIYQGPQYSVKPMDDAEKLIRQVYRSFPDESQKNHDYLVKVWQEIRLNKAKHDWAMARYYDRRGEYAAARQYYARVQREYQDTSLAKDAKQSLARLGNAPAEREQPLPWLARMFPTTDRAKTNCGKQSAGLDSPLDVPVRRGTGVGMNAKPHV